MYKITIIEVTEREVKAPREWVKLADGGGDVGAKYGYAPENPNTTKRRDEREVLTQEVPTLDLAAVIKAINNL